MLDNLVANIIIVDDHEVIRYGLTMTLESVNAQDSPVEFRVLATVSTGKELLHVLPGSGANVILLDIRLPDVNGLDLVRTLRNKGYTSEMLRILIMTELERVNIREVLDSGANGYISKDEQGNIFIDAITSILTVPEVPWLHPKIAQSMLRVELSLKASGLTDTEIKVLRYIHLSTQEIAEILQVTPKTLRNHLTNIYIKINVNSRTEAIDFVQKIGLWI